MATNQDVRAALAAFKLTTAVSPFGSADMCHIDRSGELLLQASSLLSMLAAACQDSRALTYSGAESTFSSLNQNMFGAALEGVGALVDLAHFLLKD